MKIHRNREYAVDFVFALALFLVFASSALAVAFLSLQTYRSTTLQEGENYSLRTTLAYVSQKMRHMDQAGAVSAGELEGHPALVLTQNFSGEIYTTYIYEYEGTLRELFLKTNSQVSADGGKVIAAVEDFTLDEPIPGLFCFTLTDSAGRSYQMNLNART